jgi:hypothetical protein
LARTFGLFAGNQAPDRAAVAAVGVHLGGTALGLLLGVVVIGVAVRLAGGVETPRVGRDDVGLRAAPLAVSHVSVDAPPALVPTAATVAPAAPPPARETRPFRHAGRAYTGVLAAVGTTFVAPQAGTIEVRVYQLIGGEIRIGANVDALPYFPYVTLTTATERVVYRPGALGSAVELVVADRGRVAAGDPLFTLVGDGASSWRTFYDAGAPYAVVMSRTTLGGLDLDAAAVLVAR